MQYAIGIIIQNTDTLAKLKLFFDKLKSLLNIQKIEVEPTKFIEKSVLKENAEAEIKFFIGIAPNVSKAKKDVLFANDDGIGDYYLPNTYSIEFRGQDYSYEEMKRRLIQFIGENWMGNYVILDLKSDLKDLLTKFKKY